MLKSGATPGQNFSTKAQKKQVGHAEAAHLRSIHISEE
jgi:hypothetical protein